MRSRITAEFRQLLGELSPAVRSLAAKQYAAWKADPMHASLRFKPVAPGVWSARIGRDFRALARQAEIEGKTTYVWFWIGPHKVYDRLLGK